MGFRFDNQQGDLCVDSWARCLRASSRVLRVAPHLDNDGNTLKSSVPQAIAARGGGHYAPHELKVYVDASNRFLTTGVSTHGGRLHVYMREPPQTLATVAESVFKAAVAELSRWQRFRAPESGRLYRWRAWDEKWFWEDAPGDWRQYLSPEGKEWWWNSVTEDWFLA